MIIAVWESLLRAGALAAACAFGLSGTGGQRPTKPPACRELFSSVVYIGPGMFAGGTDWEYCDEVSARSYLVEASLLDYKRMLAERGDPRWIVLDMLFQRRYSDSGKSQFSETPAELRRWFDAAMRSGANQPLIAWVAAEQCGMIGMSGSCDAIALARRVVDLEPDNGAVHLLLAEAYGHAEKKDAARAEFARAAATKGFRSPRQGLMKLLFATLQDWVPPQPGDISNPKAKACMANWPDCAVMHRYFLAMALEEMLQNWQPLFWNEFSCNEESALASDASLRSDCIRVSTAVADNDQTLLAQRIALANLVRLTRGQPSSARWRKRQREYLWITEQYSSLQNRELADRASTKAYFDTWTNEGFLAALRAELVRRGIAPMAPAGWLSADPKMRALLH